MFNVVAPHRLELHREVIDAEIVLISIEQCVSRIDAACRIAVQLGYRLDWTLGHEGLFLAGTVRDENSDAHSQSITICAFDLTDAVVGVLCLLLDPTADIFYSEDSERRRYLPAGLFYLSDTSEPTPAGSMTSQRSPGSITIHMPSAQQQEEMRSPIDTLPVLNAVREAAARRREVMRSLIDAPGLKAMRKLAVRQQEVMRSLVDSSDLTAMRETAARQREVMRSLVDSPGLKAMRELAARQQEVMRSLVDSSDLTAMRETAARQREVMRSLVDSPGLKAMRELAARQQEVMRSLVDSQ